MLLSLEIAYESKISLLSLTALLIFHFHDIYSVLLFLMDQIPFLVMFWKFYFCGNLKSHMAWFFTFVYVGVKTTSNILFSLMAI